MRKLSLTKQVTIIFITAFLITSSILPFVLIKRLDSIFQSNVFDQLESQAKDFMTTQSIDEYQLNPLFYAISYSSTTNEYNTSSNLNDILSNDSIKLLINKGVAQTVSINRYKNIIQEKNIYYVVLKYDGLLNTANNDLTIVLTDEKLKLEMVKTTVLQILLVCILAYLLGYFIILLWVTKMINDTKNIAKSIEHIGKNHYKTEIHTSRNDEIGTLVENIEMMREKIVTQEKHKQEIIQGVSHDLKTPIAIIQSYAEALEDEIYTPSKVSSIILKQCERLNLKVKKLLTLTKLGFFDINAGDFGETKMMPLIAEISKIYSDTANINITLDLDNIEFKGDIDSWQIVIENIMDNAIRYAASCIIITLKENCLSIYNDGKHVDENKLESIFEAYQKGRDGNFGIGLSIVKRTAKQFGYDVKVINRDDGVEFLISR